MTTKKKAKRSPAKAKKRERYYIRPRNDGCGWIVWARSHEPEGRFSRLYGDGVVACFYKQHGARRSDAAAFAKVMNQREGK